ncbi:hypothetical protein [Luteimonas sp. MC1895]|uniref:hypothetical protein n=1 Tax=Luteimonas sp. MC1895 TaxID=2819513 RepID=UPI0018F0D35D|nr:hypothetical protein [Luteimonas sp. MC1895]MBJ6978053.1 hypothetical protein [Luteimonas sp. MC1895]
MDAVTKARMHALAQTSVFYASLSGAQGTITDEGDDYRPAIFERSLLDGLYVAMNPLGSSPAEMALRDRARNSKNIKELRMIADLFANDPPESAVRSRNVKVIKDFTDSRYLHPKQRFHIERERGVKQLLEDHAVTGITSKREAETEWMKRKAEQETGVDRDESDPARRKVYEDAYDALRARDFR